MLQQHANRSSIMAVSKKSTKNPPTVLSAVLDYTASTITLLILDDAGAPYVRVLVDAPDAQAASDVQVRVRRIPNIALQIEIDLNFVRLSDLIPQ